MTAAGKAERTERRPEVSAAKDMSETVLDLRGLRCPQPVLRAAKAMRQVPIGGTLVLECTDPLTAIDVPHFVNQTGQALTGHEHAASSMCSGF